MLHKAYNKLKTLFYRGSITKKQENASNNSIAITRIKIKKVTLKK